MKKTYISDRFAKLAKDNEALAILILYKYFYKDLELLMVILILDQGKYSPRFLDNCKHVLTYNFQKIVLENTTLLHICMTQDLINAAIGINSFKDSQKDRKLVKVAKQWIEKNT